jgi:hypothetical protein
MTAEPGRTYAQILGGKLHWIFTVNDLPEWAEDGEFAIQVIDVTDLDPAPQVGWLWNGSTFSEPPVPVPHVVSRFQAKAALLAAGYLPAVEAMMANPATPEIAKLAWAEAIEFRRTSPTVTAMGAALGLDDAALDALFTTAAGIEA